MASTIADRPFTTLPSIILSTGPFILLWSLFRRQVERRGPYTIATYTTRINNQLYSVFSAFLAYLILNTYFNFHDSFFPDTSLKRFSSLQDYGVDLDLSQTRDVGYLYHLSKLYEYVDIFNLVGQGNPIGNHMAFHHLTMPYLTYFRVWKCYLGDDDWRVFGLLNAVHHTLIYAYFGGVWEMFGVTANRAMRSLTRVTGTVQLAAGLVVDIAWIVRFGKDESVNSIAGAEDEGRNRMIAVLLLARYAMLFWEEVKGGSKQRRPGRARDDDLKKEQ